jgi:hypothetical protein
MVDCSNKMFPMPIDDWCSISGILLSCSCALVLVGGWNFEISFGLYPLPLESGNQIVVGVYGVFFPTIEGILLCGVVCFCFKKIPHSAHVKLDLYSNRAPQQQQLGSSIFFRTLQSK